MLRPLAIAISAVALVLSATPSSAHHAINAQFTVTKEMTKQGALVKVDNINPHSYWQFEVKEPNGKTQLWRFESVSPGNLRRAGLKIKDDLQVGRTYTFFYNPSRDGSNTGLLRGLVFGERRVNFSADYMPPPAG